MSQLPCSMLRALLLLACTAKAMDEDEMAMARKKEGGLMAADDADEI